MSQEKYRHEAARWLQQAKADLEAAKDSRKAEHCEWACFQAQQAAEKALKAIWFFHCYDPWGHSLVRLVQDFPHADIQTDLRTLTDSAKLLDKLYIPTRYPNGLPDLTPSDTYTDSEADAAVDAARRVIDNAARELWDNDN